MAPDPRLRAFGDAVRARRQASGLSQEKLAELAGLHRTYIGSVERGERNLSLINIYAIASALGCAPAELLRDAATLEGRASRLPRHPRSRLS